MKLALLGLGVLLVVGAVGCSRSEAAVEPGASAHAMPVGSDEVHETLNYKLTLEAAGPYKKGEQGVVKVVLVTKGDFHINEQYPYRFVVQDPPADGVKYPKASLRRADGVFSKTTAEMAIPFVVDRTGEVKVGGTFSLSVCTASNCLLDKRPLELPITVE